MIYDLLLALALQFTAEPPATVSGHVLDPKGIPTAGVALRLDPDGPRTMSDEFGRFTFEQVRPGPWWLAAEHPDFQPVRIKIEPQWGTRLRVDIRLSAVRTQRVQLDVLADEDRELLPGVPGSSFNVTATDLQHRAPADANEILRSLPGLNVREDSGPAAMRLSVGVRGLNPDRSRSLLVLEDGIPVALAPYGEPELYYSPPIERMSGVELLKGSGSLVHGPQTVGGVLNFMTPDPPRRPQGWGELAGGQYGTRKARLGWGGSREETGWLFHLVRKQGDGWRQLWYRFNDLLTKVHLAPSDAHRLSWKLVVYDELSNSTYLGLTEELFRRNPSLNPVPNDLLAVRRLAASVLQQATRGPSLLLANQFYTYTTTRNWRRQQFDRTRRPGVHYVSVFGDETLPGAAIFLRDSSINNNREFDVAAAESRLEWHRRPGTLQQRLQAGIRFLVEAHRDRRIDGARAAALSGTLREDEKRIGTAWSGYLRSELTVGQRLSLAPGLRLENYRYRRHILRQPIGGVPTDVSIWGGDSVLQPIPGLGIVLRPAKSLVVFAGSHRGFAPPRVKDAITHEGQSLQLDAERSWNYELGLRARADGLRVQATGFLIDFTNQIIPAAMSGGAVTTLVNAGATRHAGVEFLLSTLLRERWSQAPDVQADFRFDWLPDAKFTAGPNRGFRLPYAPDNLFGTKITYRHRFGAVVTLEGVRVANQFADNRQSVAPSPDGTIGLIPGYWLWNAAGSFEKQAAGLTLSPYVTVKNLAGRVHIASRAPQGIQPGMFRHVQFGLRFQF